MGRGRATKGNFGNFIKNRFVCFCERNSSVVAIELRCKCRTRLISGCPWLCRLPYACLEDPSGRRVAALASQLDLVKTDKIFVSWTSNTR